MAKQDAVAAQKAAYHQAVDAAQESALDVFGGACYDQGLSDAPPLSGGGISQSDEDAAVAAQKASDDQAMAVAQAAHDAQIQSLNQQIVDLQNSGQASAAVVKGLQDNIAAIQATFDSFKAAVNAVLNPSAPQPVQPDPAPAPEDPSQPVQS